MRDSFVPRRSDPQSYLPPRDESTIQNLMNISRVIDDPYRIQRYLQTALLGEELVEIQMEDRTRTFFSCLVDDLPPMEEITEEDGTVLLHEPLYMEASYLEQKHHVLIAPMEPVNGNALIRRSAQVFLRFPTGTDSLEGETSFSGIKMVRDKPYIALTFPKLLTESPQRRYYRAKLLANLETPVQITLPDNETATCPLVDIGVNGMAFESPWPPARLPIGLPITVTMNLHEFQGQPLPGIVRSLIKSRNKKNTQITTSRCGVQFSVANTKMASLLEKTVAAVQRAHLRILRERADEAGIELLLPF